MLLWREQVYKQYYITFIINIYSLVELELLNRKKLAKVTHARGRRKIILVIITWFRTVNLNNKYCIHGFISGYCVWFVHSSVISLLCGILRMIVWSFIAFRLAIVLSPLIRFMDSDYPFGIFKLFFNYLIPSKDK
jgi:hypothetical protein